VALHHRHLIDQAIMHRLSLSPLGTFFAPHSHSGGTPQQRADQTPLPTLIRMHHRSLVPPSSIQKSAISNQQSAISNRHSLPLQSKIQN
jgi:hypothetical protein